MTEAIVRVEFQGRETLVDAFSYRDAFSAFLALLREIDISLAHGAGVAGPSLDWFIRSLHTSNPTVELLAESRVQDIDLGNPVIQLAQDSLETLERSPVRPPTLSYPALERCQDLGDLIRRDSIAEVVVASQTREVRVTERLDANVRQVMGQKVETLGSVEGELEMVTIRGRRYFSVYSLATGRATRCYFEESLLERVREALGKLVVVKGTVRAFAHEEGREISSISELTILEKDEGLPTPADVRGIMPGLTGDIPSERYLKERWGGRRQT